MRQVSAASNITTPTTELLLALWMVGGSFSKQPPWKVYIMCLLIKPCNFQRDPVKMNRTWMYHLLKITLSYQLLCWCWGWEGGEVMALSWGLQTKWKCKARNCRSSQPVHGWWHLPKAGCSCAMAWCLSWAGWLGWILTVMNLFSCTSQLILS